MSVEDGLVMQLHPGSSATTTCRLRALRPRSGLRHPARDRIHAQPAAAARTITATTRVPLVLFTLDETTYSRELAPLAGHYPALRLGPPWWFHDSLEGMRRFRDQVTETAGLYNTAGFNDERARSCRSPHATTRPARRREVPRGPRLAAHHRVARRRGDDWASSRTGSRRRPIDCDGLGVRPVRGGVSPRNLILPG